ncbi:signal peptide peptidase SppA [Novosphingobium sp. AP12]|uniref:signal peptide peptidase SppA n=1 Tax=Novosphingobium sp. AP12 TaxID=1144305 RepID=UPI0002720FC5|nr:signal peptide peptidase SppA [Novosphingobium sp. AP12]EJL30545.1 signal peptide peptidase SppA, 67K type [Novosphingobium sp. AP12]
MRFASKVWKLLVAVKDAMALLFLLMFFGLVYAALSARPAPGRVEDGALLLELDGTVVEEKSQSDPIALLMGAGGSVHEFQARDIERALLLAAKDQRIKVVVLDLSRFLGGRYIHLHDIGEAIDEVRKAGKPVLTFANAYADDGVLLAAHASEAWVDPMGGAFVTGPGGNLQFYKGLFDKFKVNAHVYRVGTYKSAVEPYMRTDLSPEAREDLQFVLDAQWNAYRADIAKARPKAQLDRMTGDPVAWLKLSGGDIAQAGKAAGLIDRIGDKTEFENRVEDIAGESAQAHPGEDAPDYAHTGLATWLAANPVKEEGAAIGVVTIAGEIVDGDAGPGTAGGDRIARLLDENLDAGKYKALVVRIDSPGGSVMASERIRRAILRWKAAKIPVVVSMGSMAASGGYWVSTPGQRVFAEPATVTGSIGVFAVITSFEKTLADFGVTSDGVGTTPLSGQPDLFAGLTPAVDGMLQTSVESNYARFLDVVGKARGKTALQVDAIAQGRVWPGAEAQHNGLVDQMGGLGDALTYAAKLGKVGNGKWHAAYLEEDPDPFAAFVEGLTSGSQEQATAYDFAGLVATRQQLQAGQAVSRLDALLGVKGVQAYCLECGMEPDYRQSAKAPERGPGVAMLLRLAGWK